MNVILLIASIVLICASVGILIRSLFLKKAYMETLKYNEQVVDSNEKLLKTIELQQFSSIEHGLQIYEHYNNIQKIVMQVDPGDITSLDRALNMARYAQQSVATNFSETFGVHPEIYKARKLQMSAKNDLGQPIFLDASIN